MNADRQYLCVKKLKGRDIVRVAAKHNLRELQAELGAGSHIDHTRIGLNQVMAGPDKAADVAAYADGLMRDAGVGNMRRDAVRGIEIIVSLPASSTIDRTAFFTDSLAWAQRFFAVPVLSAVIHLDEAAPHCHVLLLPLVDGRMVGSDLVGNKTRLQAMQASYFEQVGRRYGLTRPKARKRFNQAVRDKAASIAVSAIQSSPELLDRHGVESALLVLVRHDPEPLLAALGLSMPLPAKSSKSFVGIMTKPCKPEKPIGFKQQAKPIGFAHAVPSNNQTLSCVGFAPESPHLPEHESCPDAAITRCRDDLPSEYWDSELGEYRLPDEQPRQTRLG
ncbi:MAG: hypothetical protein GZ085_05670 [Sulfuriferula multivorans]|uniref:Plasmid recombination enzyme n=1 Tax=Sulfuriferula multivorans TaxID=1559896 RepID=A0A7C9K9T3_9PROT|nr:hypothetical protein [Sulfuriferula multivorans]